VEYRAAEGKPERFPDLFDEILHLKVGHRNRFLVGRSGCQEVDVYDSCCPCRQW
jgi:hypothetical protein